MSKETVQLDLFGYKPPKKEKPAAQQATDIKSNLPAYDPNAFHRVYEIKPDGSREWVDSYSATFSAYYAMQLFYCNRHKLRFFYKPDLKRAAEHISISKSLLSVMLEEDSSVFIITSKKGTTAREGISGSMYEYNAVELR